MEKPGAKLSFVSGKLYVEYGDLASVYDSASEALLAFQNVGPCANCGAPTPDGYCLECRETATFCPRCEEPHWGPRLYCERCITFVSFSLPVHVCLVCEKPMEHVGQDEYAHYWYCNRCKRDVGVLKEV